MIGFSASDVAAFEERIQAKSKKSFRRLAMKDVPAATQRLVTEEIF